MRSHPPLVMTGAKLYEVIPLLDSHHYLGSRCADPVHVFAWRYQGGLLGDTGAPVAAIVYASPANRYFGNGALEITRLVRAPSLDLPLSSFVAWSVRWLKQNTKWKFCLAYADTGAGHHGGIYQALGFDYVAESQGHSYWENPATGARCSSRAFDQRRKEYQGGWNRKPGTLKYLYIRPLKERRNKLLARFGWSPLPYPKPRMNIMGNFKKGDEVKIENRKTVLQTRLDCPGGWIVDPPIGNCRYWNEDEMTRVHATETGKAAIA